MRKTCGLLFGHLLFSMLVLVLASCSSDDYVNAIPCEIMAVISMDVSKMSGVDSKVLFKTMLRVSDLHKSGIDFSSKIYLFESAQGNLGFCAKVNNEGDLSELLVRLSKAGICTELQKRRGYSFCVLHDVWLVGYSDGAILVMGPVETAGQAELQNEMAKYLGQSEEESIKENRIYAKLDSMEAPMCMVAEAQALPEKFVAPFMIGAPQGADASQVLIAARMNVRKGYLLIDGETFSFNKAIDRGLKNVVSTVYRPISGKFLKSMPLEAPFGMFVNVKGEDFLYLLRANKSIQALLVGINTAVDMDNIIKSVNGDMSIVMSELAADRLEMSMAAELANSNWLADVGYWKQSVPRGGRIVDWMKKAYYYTDGKTAFYFGVDENRQFFSGSSAQEALASVKTAAHSLPTEVQAVMQGKKMAIVVNLSSVANGKVDAVTSMLRPIFGRFDTIVYSLK